MRLKSKSKSTRLAIQRRLELERWLKDLGSRRRRKARRSSNDGAAMPRRRGSVAARKRTNYAKAPLVVLPVPDVLDLDGAHLEATEFVRRVVLTVRAGNRACLDFTEVTRLRAGALAYLLAAIHRLRLSYGDMCVTGTYPHNKRIDQQLAACGFYSLLKVKVQQGTKPASKGIRFIQFKSGQEISGETIAKVREELLGEDLRMPRIIGRTIFRALSEAMTNVKHHAYHHKVYRDPHDAAELSGRWWMMASLSVATNKFTLVFFDSGVGIPKTLPRTHPIERIRHVLSLLPPFQPDDGQMIEAAMVLGRTRTLLDNRGKGLLDLARLIDEVGGGEMRIYSRSGSLCYTAQRSRAKNHPGFIEGTLIEWQLPLQRAIEALPKDLYEDEYADA